MGQIRLLEWDSLAFGGVAGELLIAPDSFGDAARLRQTMEQCVQDGVNFLSCRLPASNLQAIHALEEEGFRFVELSLKPSKKLIESASTGQTPRFKAHTVGVNCLPEALLRTDSITFRHGRFHADPRIPESIGKNRYQNWFADSSKLPNHELLEVRDGEGRAVAYFLCENKDSGGVYWHLNGVLPKFQSRGWGSEIWNSVIDFHIGSGKSEVSTRVSASNVSAINLYTRLQFRLNHPEVTLHWLNPVFETNQRE